MSCQPGGRIDTHEIIEGLILFMFLLQPLDFQVLTSPGALALMAPTTAAADSVVFADANMTVAPPALTVVAGDVTFLLSPGHTANLQWLNADLSPAGPPVT